MHDITTWYTRRTDATTWSISDRKFNSGIFNMSCTLVATITACTGAKGYLSTNKHIKILCCFDTLLADEMKWFSNKWAPHACRPPPPRMRTCLLAHTGSRNYKLTHKFNRITQQRPKDFISGRSAKEMRPCNHVWAATGYFSAHPLSFIREQLSELHRWEFETGMWLILI